MSFVGMDIDRCSQLKAHLDQAAADLNAHAANVESLLAQAGIQSCQAPGEIRDVAGWAAYRARDLQKRIDRMIAANGGSGPGFRFASPTIARDAAKQEADGLKTLLQGGDAAGVAAALAKVKVYAGDPEFAAALLHALGNRRLLALLHGTVDGDGLTGIELPPAALTTLAALLATVSRAKPNDKVVKHVLDQASPAELAALMKFGGFSSAFVARAAMTILKYAPFGTGALDKKLADARQVAIDALKADPAAAKLFFKDADHLAIMSLLRDSDPSHIAVLAQAGPGLDHVLAQVAHDDSISAAAKEELATLLVPAFFDGRIVNTKQNQDPSLALSPDELVNVLAVLMTDDAARRTIFGAASAALASQVAASVPTILKHVREDQVTSAEPQANAGGQLIALVQKAYGKMLGDDAKAAEAEAEMLKTAGHMLGAVLLEGAPVGVGGAANYAIDRLADRGSNAALDRFAAADDTGPLAKSETQMRVAVAQVLAQDAGYRASLAHAGLIKNGHLVDITKDGAEERALNRWFNTPENADLQRKVADLLLQFEDEMRH